jgi:hypothetical protein
MAFMAVVSQSVEAQIQEKIPCPAHLFVSAEEGKCGSKAQFFNPFENVELDNVQNNFTSNSWFEAGSTSVYFKGMDHENNTHFCVFKVNVLDKQIPTVSSDFTEVLAFTEYEKDGTKVIWETPKAQDNCQIVSWISTHESGEFFPIGETPVTYWFYDSAGNCSEFTFTVIVKSGIPSLAEKD